MRFLIFYFFLSCNKKEIVYQGNYQYDKIIVEIFNVKIHNIPQESRFELKSINLEKISKKKLKIDKNSSSLNYLDSIDYCGFYKIKKIYLHIFKEGSETDYYKEYLLIQNQNNQKLLKIKKFLIDDVCFFSYKLNGKYILLKYCLDTGYDVVDEDNPKTNLSYIKYAIIEIKDNNFHILEFEESEKILFEKFKEEDVQKYRKQ
jgi:hypothetical protein